MDDPKIRSVTEPSSVNKTPQKTTRDETPYTNPQWQTLSPIAIFYFFASSIKQIATNFIYLIPVAALNYKHLQQSPFIFLGGIVGVLLLLCLFAMISFRVYRFRLTDSTIEIRSGIIKKHHANLPFDRIQSIKLVQPIYYRLTGHACVQLDTAGSAQNEAQIVALTLAKAEHLKKRIMRHNAEELPNSSGDSSLTARKEQQSPNYIHKNSDTETNEQDSKEMVLNRRSIKDLVLHGLTSNRIWIFLGGFAPFYDDIFNAANTYTKDLGVDLSTLFSLQAHSIFEVALYSVAILLLAILVLAALSVLGAIIHFYGYTLTKQGNRYIRRNGLFTKNEVSMALSRVQILIRKQDWLDILIKRINLVYEQNRSLSASGTSDVVTNKIVVPSINKTECEMLINDTYPNNSLQQLIDKQAFCAISPYFVSKYCLLWAIPMSAIGLIITLKQDLSTGLITAGISYMAILGLVLLRWKRWGIAADQDFVYIRKGLFGIDYYCFATFKVQQTALLHTPLMARRNLASLRYVLASRALTIPFIKRQHAEKLIDKSLFIVESSQKSWM
jgi:putative membrane protein